jgi:hypothetical protein
MRVSRATLGTSPASKQQSWYFTRIKTTIVVLMRVKYQGGYSILALGGHYSWYFTRIKTTINRTLPASNKP